MSTEIVIPYAGGEPHRDRAVTWLLRQLDYQATIAPGKKDPWVKALAVWPAIQQSEADIIVIHDADCWTDGLALAVQAVAEGHSWAVPHGDTHRLTEIGTEAYFAGDPWQDQELARPAYRGTPGGGILVAKRDILLDVPFDPRFVNWGQEDMALGAALLTMHGRPWRGNADLIHLWHPPEPRQSRKWGSEASRLLYERYHYAVGKPVDMAVILTEAHDALAPSIT